jgi:hypothetical protein
VFILALTGSMRPPIHISAAANALDRFAIRFDDTSPVVLEGRILCRDCELERRYGVTARCKVIGHHGALATADGRICGYAAPRRDSRSDCLTGTQRHRLQIIGVSEDHGAEDAVRAFVVEHKVNYPIVMATPEIQRAFSGVAGLPTTFGVNAEGLIVQKHVGLLEVATIERQAKALAGLLPATIEHVEPERAVGLQNAAQAKEIPGVDLDHLSPDVRAATLQRLNAEPCTCGCGLTIAKCRVDDPDCGVSLPRAREIAAEVAKGGR